MSDLGTESQTEDAENISEEERLHRLVDTWIGMYRQSLALKPERASDSTYFLRAGSFGGLQDSIAYDLSFVLKRFSNDPPKAVGSVYVCPAPLAYLSMYLQKDALLDPVLKYLTLDRGGAPVVYRNPESGEDELKAVRRRARNTTMVSPYYAIGHGEEIPITGDNRDCVYPALLMLRDLTAKPISDLPDAIFSLLQVLERYTDRQASLIEGNRRRLAEVHVTDLMRTRQEMLKREGKWPPV
ncbi:MAG: hypothetical protein UX31_C0028G0005 [Candidatus Nomurabacteria bacterium GW2011_GWA1_46_11]|uniref:Uncharacterized protein n=1 Tax=Candidatus Nomurabacteria bacterium GW2011_GWA1_46_11 TaxID=1618732 RepID=A0A0G1QSQ1_9BACT|nr:MAG: hypothetical protein UX31_C0028G0005 [Candidatus Nomurabacteria bacterium GW2011_GWA1_46_11]